MTEPAREAVAAAVAAACGVPDPIEPHGVVDWDAFVRLVDRHGVAALVQRSRWLERAGAPAESCAAVARRARAETLDSLRLLAVQRRALAALTGAGVEAVVFKGPPLSIDAHGEATARKPGDLDVLVAPESVERAVDGLRAAGFAWFGWPTPEDPDRPPVGPEALARRSRLPMLRDVTLAFDGVKVELHWRLFPNPWLMPVDPSWLRSPRWLEFQGMEVPTLPLAAHWTYVLVHGTSNLWPTMKRLADVPALALRQPHLVRPDALDAADAGNHRSIATGLLVAEAVFGRFLGAQSREWAEDVGGTATLVRQSLAAIGDRLPMGRVSPRALPSVVRTRLVMRRDVRYRLDELRLLLLSASRAQAIEDPGLATLAGGPLRWARRVVRRAARPS